MPWVGKTDIDMADNFREWRENQEIVFGSIVSTKGRKKLVALCDGYCKVYHNDKLEFHGISTLQAVVIYNSINI